MRHLLSVGHNAVLVVREAVAAELGTLWKRAHTSKAPKRANVMHKCQSDQVAFTTGAKRAPSFRRE